MRNPSLEDRACPEEEIWKVSLARRAFSVLVQIPHAMPKIHIIEEERGRERGRETNEEITACRPPPSEFQ